jgi:hypothetical protein
MTTTASTAEIVMLCAPKPASRREREKIETMTTIASAATAPKVWTKSARASLSPWRRASPSARPSTRTLGTARPTSANQASATK